ncbi:MAG: hypothetical protein R3Y57_03515 [Erysipelotrichaceae bacterium]
MEIFNKHALTRNQRFNTALLYGVPSAILLGIVYGFISSLTRIQFSIVYVFFGYVIGMIIQRKGRGVQQKFSVLAAILAVVCFILGDTISLFGLSILWTPSAWGIAFWLLMQTYTALNASSLLALLFRVCGVYYAYINGRIV